MPNLQIQGRVTTSCKNARVQYPSHPPKIPLGRDHHLDMIMLCISFFMIEVPITYLSMHSLNGFLRFLFSGITKESKASWSICYFIHHKINYKQIKIFSETRKIKVSENIVAITNIQLNKIKISNHIKQIKGTKQAISLDSVLSPSTSWPKVSKAFLKLSSVVRNDSPACNRIFIIASLHTQRNK